MEIAAVRLTFYINEILILIPTYPELREAVIKSVLVLNFISHRTKVDNKLKKYLDANILRTMESFKDVLEETQLLDDLHDLMDKMLNRKFDVTNEIEVAGNTYDPYVPEERLKQFRDMIDELLHCVWIDKQKSRMIDIGE